MSKTKKLDIFNLFYSGAAVVILIGVIAKLLEWPMQDLLITGGLAIEAIVFGVSAVKFVEVKNDAEVATEATLSKVAEGLGNISTGQGGSLVLKDNGAGKFPIDNGLVNRSAETTSYENGNSESQKSDNDSKNISISINNPPSNISNNPGHSLWQLEQMDILSLAKDLFFLPEWDVLSSDEYLQLSELFKRVFDKKLPNKEAIPFLVQFPVKLPVPELKKLSIDKAHQISSLDIELLDKAFSIINFHGFFENFIIETLGEENQIRPKKLGEVQVFGGENEIILEHINQFFNGELVLTPNLECLKKSIKLKGELLLEHFIQRVDIRNEAQFNSLNIILHSNSDDLKLKLWNKFPKIVYDIEKSDGYFYFRTLVETSLSFLSLNSGKQLLNRLLEIKINEDKSIILDDVINYNADKIYFGAKNEYSVSINELFLNGELEYLGIVQNLIEKLVSDNVAIKPKLLQLFNLQEQDSKKEVFDKLNYHLNKTNTAPSGTQLAFILLYKQYVNS